MAIVNGLELSGVEWTRLLTVVRLLESTSIEDLGSILGQNPILLLVVGGFAGAKALLLLALALAVAAEDIVVPWVRDCFALRARS